MGAHHYQLDLLPRAAFTGELPAALSAADTEFGQDEATGWWARFPPSERLLAALRELLPLEQSWGETEEFVSSREWTRSDLRLWKDGGRVWHIAFRFSPLEADWELLHRFLALARGEGCVLQERASGALLVADDLLVTARLRGCRAEQFALDPEAALVAAARDLPADAS